jgi:hypothetical protein
MNNKGQQRTIPKPQLKARRLNFRIDGDLLSTGSLPIDKADYVHLLDPIHTYGCEKNLRKDKPDKHWTFRPCAHSNCGASRSNLSSLGNR